MHDVQLWLSRVNEILKGSELIKGDPYIFDGKEPQITNEKVRLKKRLYSNREAITKPSLNFHEIYQGTWTFATLTTRYCCKGDL